MNEINYNLNDSYIWHKGNRFTSVPRISAYIIIFGLIGCMLSSIIILMSDNDDEYFLYFLLPIGYAAFLIITMFAHHAIYNKVVFYIFVGLYFLKLVVTPAVSAMGDFSTFNSGIGVKDYIFSAILLSVWEPIFVSLALAIYTRCNTFGYGCNTGYHSNYIKRNSKGCDGADFIILAGILFVVLALLYYPPLCVRFHWILNIGTAQDTAPITRSWRDFFASNAREVPLGIVDTYMMVTFYVVRVLFPLMVIEKIGQARLDLLEKATASFLVIVLAAQITTEVNADTIFMSIATSILVFKLYPKFLKRYGAIIFVAGILSIAALFALKVTGSANGLLDNLTPMQRLSAVLNAYVNGPLNLSLAIKAEENYDISMGISEFLGGLPIFNHFFMGNQTTVIFNETYWGFAGRTDQLLPSLGQGYMYFGPIFAPLQQFLFIILALKLEDISDNSISVKMKGYFLFLAIVMIWTIGNNLSTIIGYGLRYLPGIIILYFIKYRCK